jgi:hypothetical protein
LSAQTTSSQQRKPINARIILKTWLPLAASWMLMSFELPFINAIVARLANAEVNLAAYGGVSFPIALTIEAPVIMLLAASTALSKDWTSYRKLQRFTLWLGGSLTALHLIVAATPIYDFVARDLLQVPEAVIDPARLGLLFLTPWSLAIAYRRFQHGAMIRYGHSEVVGQTTLLRLITVAVVLAVSYSVKTIPGTVVAGLAQGLGVTLETIYAGIRVRKIYPRIKDAPAVDETLTLKTFIAFYVPLAMTSSLWLLWQPLISGAVSRMPEALASLAVWSVVTGLMFMARSPGMAYNEVVVALLDRPKAYGPLRKFAWIISGITTVLVTVFVATPLSRWWFAFIANLSGEKVPMARQALAFGIPLGILSIFISFFQGIIVNDKRTRAIPEAVVMFLIAMGVILGIGIWTQAYQGVYVAAAAFTAAHVAQVAWLFWRSRKQRRQLAVEEG